MKKVTAIIAFLPLLICSCLTELTDKIDLIKDSTWNPTLAAPLVVGDFSMSDLAKEISSDNLDVTSNDDGITTFIYQQPSIFSQSANELLALSDQNFSTYLNGMGNLPATGLNETIKTSQTFSFDLTSPEGDKLHEILLKEGSMDLSLEGNIPFSGELNVVFNSINMDGNLLQSNYAWSSDAPQKHQQVIDLKKAIINLRNNNPNLNNKFIITTNLTIYYDGSAVDADNGFNLNINLRDLAFEKLTATFGKRNIVTEANNFNVNFSDKIQHGLYKLDEPSMQLIVQNSVGIPTSIQIANIVSYAADRTPIPLTGSILTSPIDIAYPTVPGNSKTTNIHIDKDNSNLPALLNSQPDSIAYAILGTINPLSNDAEHFVTDTSNIVSNVQLTVPLCGYIQNLALTESYDFDGTSLDEVDNALLRLTAHNAFPLQANIQAYFIDSDKNVLDSLIYDDTNIFSAAETDQQGYSIKPTESFIDIQISEDRIAKIRNAEGIIILARLNTPGSPTKSVRFKEENKLRIHIYGQTEFNVTF